jgi:hypothetical protein
MMNSQDPDYLFGWNLAKALFEAGRAAGTADFARKKSSRKAKPTAGRSYTRGAGKKTDPKPDPKSGTGKRAKPKCKKGIACGNSCIPANRKCGSEAPSKTSKGAAKYVKRSNREAELEARIRDLENQAANRRDPVKDPRPGDVVRYPVDQVAFDPKRFQYKLNQSNLSTGSVGSLAGVEKWEDNLAGVVQVWKDPGDGRTYVVNGHNRLDKAKQLGVEGVVVRFIDAKDPAEARSIGALTNIAEGRGSSVDAAKFFRDTGITRDELKARGVPLRERMAEEGLAISRLDDVLFRRVIDGQMPIGRAVAIGKDPDLTPEAQIQLMKMIDERERRGRNITNDTISELVDLVRSSTTKQEEQATLFGTETFARSNALEKASLQASIKRRLSSERKLFGAVARGKNADKLSEAGNQINTEKSAEISEQAARTLGVFDTLKNSSGAIGDILNQAADRVADGENARKVESEAYQQILKIMPDVLSGKAM